MILVQYDFIESHHKLHHNHDQRPSSQSERLEKCEIFILALAWAGCEEKVSKLLQVSDDVSPVRCCLRLTGDVAGHELPVLTFWALH